MRAARIVTVGHSNRSLEEFVVLLLAHGVRTVLDVRSLRGSLAMPQFDEETLRPALRAAGMRYRPIAELGGRRRKAAQPMANSCWRNASFRNYADHMRTAGFRRGIDSVLGEARRGPVALMCAEAVPWRCHRSLIADWLQVEERRRVDELVGDRRRPHRLSACARVVRGHLSYEALSDEHRPDHRRGAARPAGARRARLPGRRAPAVGARAGGAA